MRQKENRGLTLSVMFHSMQRLVYSVAEYVPNMFSFTINYYFPSYC